MIFNILVNRMSWIVQIIPCVSTDFCFLIYFFGNFLIGPSTYTNQRKVSAFESICRLVLNNCQLYTDFFYVLFLEFLWQCNYIDMIIRIKQTKFVYVMSGDVSYLFWIGHSELKLSNFVQKEPLIGPYKLKFIYKKPTLCSALAT